MSYMRCWTLREEKEQGWCAQLWELKGDKADVLHNEDLGKSSGSEAERRSDDL